MDKGSTSDVILSFLGDLDQEPDFFFPDLDAEAFNDDGFEIAAAPVKNHSFSNTMETDFRFMQPLSIGGTYDSDDGISDDFNPFVTPNSSFHVYASQQPISSYSSSETSAYTSSDTSASEDSGSDSETSPAPVKVLHQRLQATKSSVKLKKKKKNKMSVGEKVTTLVTILKSMRKVSCPVYSPDSPGIERLPETEQTLEEAYQRAEAFLAGLLSGDLCRPENLTNNFEPCGSVYIPALTSLFSLAHQRRIESKLSAWAPIEKSETFPDRHSGIGQVAAASRCFSRVLTDLLPGSGSRSTSINVQIKRTAMSFRNQLIAPFNWRCSSTDGTHKSVEFSGLIRCNFSQSKISFAHISFDAFTVIRQCA